MKRTKQTQKIIDTVNVYFERNGIASERNDVFNVVSWALTSAGVYSGFNYYDKEGRLSGSDNANHIKFY